VKGQTNSMIGEPDTQKLSENERLLMSKGVRITKPRLLILELLQQSCTQHFSAEELYRLLLSKGGKVGHASIHRVLTEFCAAGITVRHSFSPNRMIYELSSQNDHDHMVDIHTGQVIDYDSYELTQLAKKIAQKQGYELTDKMLVLYVKRVLN
jgi:Fur family ferric uptake transcriptional regulator